MYYFVTLPPGQSNQLQGLSDHRGLEPKDLIKLVVGQYLAGKLVYRATKKRGLNNGLSGGGSKCAS